MSFGLPALPGAMPGPPASGYTSPPAPTLIVVGNQAAVNNWGDYCYDLTGTPVAEERSTDAYMLYDADGKLCSLGYCYECYGIICNV